MGYKEFTDLDLLENIRMDDRAAFEELFHRYWEPLYQFAYKRLRSGQDAEDVVQQVFIELWERRSTQSVHFSFQSYFFTAVRYATTDHIRAMIRDSRKAALAEHHILPAFHEVSGRLESREMDDRIDGYIRTMPEQMQTIFRLSREEDLSPAEIAGKLGISEKTARNQLSLAVRHLRPLVKNTLLGVFLL